MEQKKAVLLNQKNWDSRVNTHLKDKGNFYDHEGMAKGQLSLRPIEKSVLKDIHGKKILHLMCHIAHDSISLARLGANVTGIDISEKSLDVARALAKELNVKIDFKNGDVHEFDSDLRNSFDFVLLSYGTLCWISDIKQVFINISKYLRNGGKFLLVDSHPLINILDYNDSGLQLKYNYFHSPEGEVFTSEYTYTSDQEKIDAPLSVQWEHHLSEIITGITESDMIIKEFNEYPYESFQRFRAMVKREDGYWELPSEYPRVPGLFMLLAEKE